MEQSERPADFRMTVEDVFAITGRGIVATGRIAAGTVSIGDEVRLLRGGARVHTLRVAAVEMGCRKSVRVEAGLNVGLLFQRITRADIETGDELSG